MRGVFAFWRALAVVAGVDVDFSVLSLGGMSAAAFASATGLAFARSTVSTVQTSDATIDSTPAINAACIGDRTAGGSRGLVIQHNTKNALLGDPRNLLGGSWALGTATVTAAYAAGPDGVASATRTNGTAGQYAPYGSVLTSARYCFSSWQSSTSGTNGTMQQGWLTSAPGDGLQARRAQTTTWGRLALANGVVSRQYFDVCDGRDYSGSGGDAATARDVLVDFIQREAGDFPTEAIATANTCRANDVLSLSAGSSIVTASSRVRFYAKLVPKFASTSQVFYDGSASGGPAAAAAWYLFSWGANGQNYAKILDSDKKLYVQIANGTVAVSTNAVSFVSTDVVEFNIEVGNNVASIARYRLNGGAWSDLVLSTIANVPAPSGAVGILYNDFGAAGADSGQFPCWLQRVAFLTDAGAVPTAVFNPGSLALTAWYRDATVSPWAPTASVGTSGSNGNLTDATSPTAGSALNTHNGSVYNGTSQKLAGTTNISALTSATAWSVSVLVNPAASAVVHSVNATYADPGIVTDDTNGFGPILSFTASGFTVAHYDGASWKEKSVAFTGGSVALVQAWYDGANINLQVNSAAAVSVAAGNLSAAGASDKLRLGANYNASVFCPCTIYDVMVSNTNLGSTARANIKSYINARYGLAL